LASNAVKVPVIVVQSFGRSTGRRYRRPVGTGNTTIMIVGIIITGGDVLRRGPDRPGLPNYAR
jgi:hypothetical protein